MRPVGGGLAEAAPGPSVPPVPMPAGVSRGGAKERSSETRSGGCGFVLAILSKDKNQPTRRLRPQTSSRCAKERQIRSTAATTVAGRHGHLVGKHLATCDEIHKISHSRNPFYETHSEKSTVELRGWLTLYIFLKLPQSYASKTSELCSIDINSACRGAKEAAVCCFHGGYNC
jgi:hypothetical protein